MTLNIAHHFSSECTLQEHAPVSVTTAKGRTVMVRPLAPDDGALIADLYTRLSDRTRHLRFGMPIVHNAARVTQEEVCRLTSIDPQRQAALLAIGDEHGIERGIAVAELAADADSPEVAEIALLVRDDYQGEGLGTAVANMLVQVALERGIKTLRAYVLAENRVVHHMVRKINVPYSAETLYGETTFLVQLTA